MDRLNLNKLFYFYIVAKEGSVKAASQKLHLTQPTISAQIKDLEEELGRQLFLRKHRKLELTAAGAEVKTKAEKIFSLASDLKKSSSSKAKIQKTQVRIGAIQSMANSFIYDFSMKLWRDKEVQISVTQGAISELIKKMDRDELDLVLSDGPFTRTKKHKSILLGHDKIVAVGRPSLKPLNSFPESLSQMPYLAFSNQGRLQDDIDFFFEREGIEPDKMGEVDDVTLMRVLTEKTGCFSILPYRAVRESISAGNLKVLGTFKQIQTSLWAVVPNFSTNSKLAKRLVKDYLIRKT